MSRKSIILLYLAFLMSPVVSVAQNTAGTWALKTNALEWFIGSPNIGGEVTVAPNWSVGLDAGLNPWSFGDDKRRKYFVVTGEGKYWLDENFSGHYLSLHAGAGSFDVGNFNILRSWGGFRKEHGYKGSLVRAGVGYGYNWKLGGSWNIQAEAGLGMYHASYDIFDYEKDGRKVKKLTKTFFAPTKLGVNLVYVFGTGNSKKPKNLYRRRAIRDSVEAAQRARREQQVAAASAQAETAKVQTAATEAAGAGSRLANSNKSVLEMLRDKYPFIYEQGVYAKVDTTIVISFPEGSTRLDLAYKSNQAKINVVRDALLQLKEAYGVDVDHIDIVGTILPVGKEENQNFLDYMRADVVKKYMETKMKLYNYQIAAVAGGLDWAGIRKFVSEGSYANRSEIVSVIDKYPSEKRREQIEAIDGGKAWQYISTSVLPKLSGVCYVKVFYRRTM